MTVDALRHFEGHSRWEVGLDGSRDNIGGWALCCDDHVHADGSSELYDGLQRFNDEAVSKILSLINDDLEQLIDRAKAVCSLMEDYQSYAGKSAEMTGSVQFLIRTPEI